MAQNEGGEAAGRVGGSGWRMNERKKILFPNHLEHRNRVAQTGGLGVVRNLRQRSAHLRAVKPGDGEGQQVCVGLLLGGGGGGAVREKVFIGHSVL